MKRFITAMLITLITLISCASAESTSASATVYPPLPEWVKDPTNWEPFEGTWLAPLGNDGELNCAPFYLKGENLVRAKLPGTRNLSGCDRFTNKTYSDKGTRFSYESPEGRMPLSPIPVKGWIKKGYTFEQAYEACDSPYGTGNITRDFSMLQSVTNPVCHFVASGFPVTIREFTPATDTAEAVCGYELSGAGVIHSTKGKSSTSTTTTTTMPTTNTPDPQEGPVDVTPTPVITPGPVNTPAPVNTPNPQEGAVILPPPQGNWGNK